MRLYCLLLLATVVSGFWVSHPSSVSPSSSRNLLIQRSTASDDEVEAIWRANSKPLLRVGRKNGVQASHRRSLDELLAAHGFVCVKVNGCRSPEEVNELAASLLPSEDTDQILLTKGVSVLFSRRESQS